MSERITLCVHIIIFFKRKKKKQQDIQSQETDISKTKCFQKCKADSQDLNSQ